MDCENLPNCDFFKKFLKERESACDLFVEKFCRGGRKEDCARYIYKQINHEMPSVELLPSGTIDFPDVEAAKQEASKCRKNHQCLSGKMADLCRIEARLTDDLQIISCLEKKECSYLNDYGQTKVCGCPLRAEIFRKYYI